MPAKQLLSFLFLSLVFLTWTCEKNIKNCSSNLRHPCQDCSFEFKNVCAFFYDGTSNSDLNQRLTLNECTACQDPLVRYYTAEECESEKVFCDVNNRPKIQDCSQYEEKVICGYYKEDCPLEFCGTSVSNACAACSDPKIVYYKAEKCKSEEKIQSCLDNPCEMDLDLNKEEVFEPVCGFRANCIDGDCTQTFANVCQACKTGEYSWYQNGVCKKDKNYCSSDSQTKNFDDMDQPVCAFFLDKDGFSLSTTIENIGNPCLDPSVEYYVAGKCGKMRDDMSYCLPNFKPELCNDVYQPVCGFFNTDSNKDLSHRIYQNACAACHDEKVLYHTPGPCVFTCKRDPFLVFECVGSAVNPVCATYISNGVKSQVSLKSSCIACNNNRIQTDNYTDGICPGDEGIRCENEYGSYRDGFLSPVCGIYQESCSESSCRQTFAEPAVACSHPSVILYKPGECPEDKGIPCDPYRAQTEENKIFWSHPRYNNVCGHYIQNCNETECSKTFSDQFVACNDLSVLFFTKGPCAGENI